MTPEAISDVLYMQSGLLGLSGVSNDVKALLESPLPAAAFALDYFALKTAQQIAAMATSLGGLDGLVFTGGIGENAAPVREKSSTISPSCPRLKPTSSPPMRSARWRWKS